jgi:hypothetical protein
VKASRTNAGAAPESGGVSTRFDGDPPVWPLDKLTADELARLFPTAAARAQAVAMGLLPPAPDDDDPVVAKAKQQPGGLTGLARSAPMSDPVVAQREAWAKILDIRKAKGGSLDAALDSPEGRALAELISKADDLADRRGVPSVGQVLALRKAADAVQAARPELTGAAAIVAALDADPLLLEAYQSSSE